MKLLLNKETKLTASLLSYMFIAFALMTMIPGYPILVGAFFVCFGIFHTFQSAREANDTIYTALLPVRKSDVVKAKYIFTVFIQLCAFVIMIILTLLRMKLLSGASVYTQNAMMNANFAYLGYSLMVFAVFNIFFLGNFFKTAYKVGTPFLIYGIVSFVVIGLGEALHHFPSLTGLNATGFADMGLQLSVLALGAALYVLGTLFSMKASIRRFDKLDL